MYELTIETSGFAAAHNLREYEGACERLHGHNWRVKVTVRAKKLDKIGIGVDFKILKRETEVVMEKLDHRYLNEIPPFDKINPSAENLARYIFEELSASLNNKNVKVKKIKVWESAKAAASYSE